MARCSKPKIAKIDLVRNHRFVDLVEEGFDVALRLAVPADLDIAIMAASTMHKSAARRNPALMPPDLAIRSRDLYAAYPRNRRLPSKVGAFIDFTTEKVYRQSHRLF